ncbi:MAG: hypothetical protein GKS05_06755 [Nitrospirales bacterium]|nr:hypothetical protein [Nitrospirales bacterium]
MLRRNPPFISTGTLIEIGMVVFNRYRTAGSRPLDDMIRDIGFRIESIIVNPAQLSHEAYDRYGKASKRKAGITEIAFLTR